MKLVASLAVVLALTGCGTIGGAVSGAGQDLSKAGEWIKNR
jgi:predicted small secreted protein